MIRRVLLMSAAAVSFAALATGPGTAQTRPDKFVVFFAEWSSAIDDAALGVVARAAAAAKAHPGSRVVVKGFADKKGSDAANLLLSQLRAQRVVDELVVDGVDADSTDMQVGVAKSVGIMGRRVEISVTPAS